MGAIPLQSQTLARVQRPPQEASMKVGIIGMGTIGRRVASGLDSGEVSGVELGALSSRNLGRAMEFAKSLETPPPVVTMEEVPPLVDLVIEAAGQDSVDPIAQATLRSGKDLMVLSCGALLDRDDLLTLAADNGVKHLRPVGRHRLLGWHHGRRHGKHRVPDHD